MNITVEKMQAVRVKLEEKYTHVTFVKTEKGLNDTYMVWTVGEDMETIMINTEWDLVHLFTEIECYKLRQEIKPGKGSEKFWYFKEVMKMGLIPPNGKLYKKYSQKKLIDLFEAQQ